MAGWSWQHRRRGRPPEQRWFLDWCALDPSFWIEFDSRISDGLCLETSSRVDSHPVFNDEVFQLRIAKRKSGERRWPTQRVERLDALPCLMRVRDQVAQRGRREITWNCVTKYGVTPGCKACSVDSTQHNTQCLERFLKIFEKDDVETAAASGKNGCDEGSREGCRQGRSPSCGVFRSSCDHDFRHLSRDRVFHTSNRSFLVETTGGDGRYVSSIASGDFSADDVEMRRDSMPKRCSSPVRNPDTVDDVPDSKKTRHTAGLQVRLPSPRTCPTSSQTSGIGRCMIRRTATKGSLCTWLQSTLHTGHTPGLRCVILPCLLAPEHVRIGWQASSRRGGDTRAGRLDRGLQVVPLPKPLRGERVAYGTRDDGTQSTPRIACLQTDDRDVCLRTSGIERMLCTHGWTWSSCIFPRPTCEARVLLAIAMGSERDTRGEQTVVSQG